MGVLKIEKYVSGDEVLIYSLIRNVYDEFVAKDYSDEGNSFFYKWIQPSCIAERQRNEINLLLAYFDQEMAGVIEIRDNKNISLLFV